MSGDKSAQRHRPQVALVGELLHELARESQCDLAHLLGREVADRMRVRSNILGLALLTDSEISFKGF